MQPITLRVLSSAFQEGQPIPARYTADGEDLSPPLRWSNPPAGTRSLAIVCEDPDAPGGLFVHWIAWNIKPDQRHCNEGVRPGSASVTHGICQGRNDFGKEGYAGPNPPHGPAHRYAFAVYALDREVELEPGATREELERAMSGHILAQGRLVTNYQH